MKKRRANRIWGFLQAVLICCLLVFPLRASALSGTTGGLSWSLLGGTLRISGSGAMPNYTDANMPPWYDAADAVNRIVVDEGVTTVGDLAFYGCSTAARAALPSTVTSIGDRAFKNCTAMTYVNLPQGLVSIGEAAFESCESLNGILLPDSLRTIESFAFDRCTALTSIVIPAGVTDLGMVVFYNCTGLTRATIRCPIDKLPDWFFHGCSSLTEVDLPETVTRTGDQAFHNCTSLSTVNYTGAAAQDISDSLVADQSTRFAEISESGESTAPVTSTTFNEKTATTTNVTVTQTEQAVITETAQTSYTYALNGEEITLEQAMTATESENVEITGVTNSAVSATVSGSDGWKDVAKVAREAALRRSESGSVDVEVQLTGSTVGRKDLAAMAGVGAKLTVTTTEGCAWVVDTAKKSRTSFGSGDLDLGFSVEMQESAVSGIQSDTVYQVEFASDVVVASQVGVPVKVNSAQQTATIYEKTTSGVTEISSAVVDESGYAWLPVGQVSQNKDYYVAINAEGADTSNALVPDSLKEDYGVDYVETLTDGSGKQYQVGERESRWGITGKQFTTYVLIAVAAMVLIVTGVMITLNKISKSKAKYAAMAAADAEYEIDEDALRLQVMQEMLEEARRENGGE